MKCNQKLCQRNKNLNNDGTCNVCEDVIAECKKIYDKIKKKCVIEKVEIVLKDMINTHKKLSKGEKVDNQIVSNLLLGGVVNIIDQHDTIEDVEKRLEEVQNENVTNQTKLIAMDENGVVLKESKERF
jgi:hypothetical protein